MLGVLDEDGVVDLEQELADAKTPNPKHTHIKNITHGPLRAIGNSFSNSSVIVPATKKPAPTSRKSGKITRLKKLGGDGSVPALMRGESGEVSDLELGDELAFELGVLGHGVGFAVIVG